MLLATARCLICFPTILDLSSNTFLSLAPEPGSEKTTKNPILRKYVCMISVIRLTFATWQKGAVKVACCLLIQIRWHLICQFSHQLHIWQVVSIATNNIYSVIGLWYSPIKIWCTLGYSFEIYFPKFVCWERIYFADELLPLFRAERTLCWKGHLKIQRKI